MNRASPVPASRHDNTALSDECLVESDKCHHCWQKIDECALLECGHRIHLTCALTQSGSMRCPECKDANQSLDWQQASSTVRPPTALQIPDHPFSTPSTQATASTTSILSTQKALSQEEVTYGAWAHVDSILTILNDQSDQLTGVQGLAKSIALLEAIHASIDHSYRYWQPEQVTLDEQQRMRASLADNMKDWIQLFVHHLIPAFRPNDASLPGNDSKFESSGAQADEPLVKNSDLALTNSLGFDYLRYREQFKQRYGLLMNAMVSDQKSGEASDEFKHVEPIFRGVHQMCEVMFWVQHQLLNAVERQTNATAKSDLLHRASRLYDRLGQHIKLLKQMDLHAYASYRPAISGTSGAGSTQLKQLKLRTHAIERQFKATLDKTFESKHNDVGVASSERNQVRDRYQAVITEPEQHPAQYQELSGLTDFITADLMYWSEHASLAAATVGMDNEGTQGMNVAKLFDRSVVRFKHATPLRAIEAAGRTAMVHRTDLINADGIGSAIAERLKTSDSVNLINSESKFDYQPRLSPDAKPLSSGVVIHQQSPQSELIYQLPPRDTKTTTLSPFHGWFETTRLPDLAHYKRFETFGMGLSVGFAQQCVGEVALRRSVMNNSIWQQYFEQTLPKFEQTVLDLLRCGELRGSDLACGDSKVGVSEIGSSNAGENQLKVTEGANNTELLDRVLSALPEERPNILTTANEFLAADRAFAGLQRRNPERIELCDAPMALLPKLSQLDDNHKFGLIFFSQVYSNSQQSLTADEMSQILDAVPPKVAVLIDITQGFCNVPLDWGALLKGRDNVMLIGSFVKHGRSGEGVGFLVHPPRNPLSDPIRSGWTANLSGLGRANTRDSKGAPAFDPGGEWRGGTPNNIAHVELAIQTWRAVAQAGESVRSLHAYVQSMIGRFMEQLQTNNVEIIGEHNLLEAQRRSANPEVASNALVFETPHAEKISLVLNQKGFGCDSRSMVIKQEHGPSRESLRLRLGFGIEHGPVQVDALVKALVDIQAQL